MGFWSLTNWYQPLKKLSEPLQSDLGHWRSDHRHLKNHLNRYKGGDYNHSKILNHNKSDRDHWRRDHSEFKSYLSNYKSDLGQWTSDNSHLENYVSHYKSDLCYCSIFLAPDQNSWFLISNIHVQNKKYGNFVSISRLTGKCAAQKLKRSSSLWTCLHHVVILRKQKKITHFFYDFSLIVSLQDITSKPCLYYDY